MARVLFIHIVIFLHFNYIYCMLYGVFFFYFVIEFVPTLDWII